jgi:hypothetical protein
MGPANVSMSQSYSNPHEREVAMSDSGRRQTLQIFRSSLVAKWRPMVSRDCVAGSIVPSTLLAPDRERSFTWYPATGVQTAKPLPPEGTECPWSCVGSPLERKWTLFSPEQPDTGRSG